MSHLKRKSDGAEQGGKKQKTDPRKRKAEEAVLISKKKPRIVEVKGDESPEDTEEDTEIDDEREEDGRGDHNQPDANTPQHIKKFEPKKQVKIDSFIIVNGQRRYGKTIWVRWLLSELQGFYPSGGYVFTRSKHNKFWSQHFPNGRIYNGLGGKNLEILREILALQQDRHERLLGEDNFTFCPYIVIILDDVIGDKKNIRYNALLNEIVFVGRHFNTCMIVCTQDAKGLPPDFHQNADIVAMTFSTQRRQLEIMEDNYGALFRNEAFDFNNMIKEYTQDHQFLVVDRTEAKYSLDQMFYWSKAEENPPKFKIGSDKFWTDAKCSWEMQLEIYKRQRKKEDMEPKDWVKISTQQFKNEKSEKEIVQRDYTREREKYKQKRIELEDQGDQGSLVELETNDSMRTEADAKQSEYLQIQKWVEDQFK